MKFLWILCLIYIKNKCFLLISLILFKSWRIHYQFNLRDSIKVFEGINKASRESYDTPIDFIKLWCHEFTRVFSDRFTNEDD